jgi:hypothetical protein
MSEPSTNWINRFNQWSELVRELGAEDQAVQVPKDERLSTWLFKQREKKRKNLLGQWEVELLNSKGINWEVLPAVIKQKPSRAIQANIDKLLDAGRRVGWETLQDNPGGEWARLCSAIRTGRKKGKLTDDQILDLTNAGFIWDWQAFKVRKKLDQSIDELIELSKTRQWEDIFEERELSIAASGIRSARKNEKLIPQQIEKLDRAGFIWDWQKVKAERTWNHWFEKLVAYTKVHGNPNLNRRRSGYQTLANWVWTQRVAEGKGELTDEQVKKLKDLGVFFDLGKHNLVKALDVVEAHHQLTGEWRIPSTHAEHGNFIRVRNAIQNNQLSEDQLARMDAIGFDANFDVNSHHAEQLIENFLSHGTFEYDKKVKGYVRNAYRDGRLAEEYVARLEELGFEWRERKSRRTFEEILKELQEWKHLHGHLDIPLSDPQLGATVNALRTKRNRGDMSEEHQQALVEIGFLWASGGRKQRYYRISDENRKLVSQYYMDNGHVNVRVSIDGKLYQLVKRIRSKQAEGKLSPEDEEYFSRYGFDFSA